jgi:hypothetical protein
MFPLAFYSRFTPLYAPLEQPQSCLGNCCPPPLGKTAQISKPPYSPIAGSASPHAGVLVWFLLGGWGGLAQNQFSRASLGVLRPARALGLVGLAWQALGP